MEKQHQNILGFGVLVLLLISCKLYPEKPLSEYADEAKTYCVSNGMDTSICILIDMKQHSGKNRFYLWDFKGDSVVFECPVTHGIGGKKGVRYSSPENVIFSNVSSSHASSIGKYKIGDRGWSNWGIHVNYKLHGLDTTNSNAFRRYIVLHSWEIVADQPTFPNPAPYSWGCPAISDNNMRKLDQFLKERKNVLLWIFN